MAIRSKYLFKTHPKVEEDDLKGLPEVLERDFWEIYQLILKSDPYNCGGLPNHPLKGKLRGYRALEVDWNGVAYRLVYRVDETPSPRRVLVISFAEHDPAYEKAVARVIVIPNKNHQAESGSILLPSSDRDGRITENNWNNYKK